MLTTCYFPDIPGQKPDDSSGRTVVDQRTRPFLWALL